MSCEVLELDLMDVCLSISSLINSGEALSLNIIRMERLMTIEGCYEKRYSQNLRNMMACTTS